MKRNYFFVLIASLMLLVSCGSSSNSDGKNPSELVGTYSIMGTTLELKKDGTAIEKSSMGENQRTWYVENGKLCLVIGETGKRIGKYSLSDNVLTWYWDNAFGGSTKMTYTKIEGTISNSTKSKTNGLEGKWVLKSINGNESQKEVLKLNDDGTLYIKIDNGEMAGIWTFCDDLLNTVILSGSGAECNEFYSIEGSFTLNDDTLIWNTIIEGEKQTHTYKRD